MDQSYAAPQAAPDSLLETRIQRALRQPRRPVFAVFDIDNTLVDTRHRTLRAAHLFAAERLESGHPMGRLELEQTPYDGADLAALFDLDPSLHAPLFQFWEDFFWRAESFDLDHPVPTAVRWAHAANDAGFRVVYLTGRIQVLHRETLAQLERLKLPVSGPDALICKPRLGVYTPSFKGEHLLRMTEKGHIAFFLTESQGDVAGAQAHPELADVAVLIDFPVGPQQEPEIAADTPIIYPR